LFIHRYRDFTDIIRIECANNIRFWIKEYPIYFLNDNYTRYIGWFLSDKVTLKLIFNFNLKTIYMFIIYLLIFKLKLKYNDISIINDYYYYSPNV